MQTEYRINRCSRRCAVQDRPLEPGEAYYSVVLEEDEQWVRRDISAAAWDEPPERAIGWWSCRMPSQENRKLKLAPDAVLLDLLRETPVPADPQSQGDRTAIRYLLALLLLRRRVVKPAASSEFQQGQEDGSGEEDRLILEDPAGGSAIEVAEWNASAADIERVEAALVDLVYCDADS